MKLKKLTTIFLIIFFSIGIAGSAYGATSLVGSLSCTKDGTCNPCNFIELLIIGSDIIIGLSGTFALLMFIYGGILMITAYGNEGQIKKGKDVLIATVIGILIVLFAWTFINIIIEGFFGKSSDILNGSPWQNVGGMCS